MALKGPRDTVVQIFDTPASQLDLAGFETVLAGFLARVGAWREIVRQGAPRDWHTQPAIALFGLGPMFGDQVAYG